MTQTAREALNKPITSKVLVDRTELAELDVVRNQVDISSVVLDLVKFRQYSVDVRASVVSADVELSIDGAHQLTITIQDTHRRLHRSGILNYAVELEIEGWHWRLIKRRKDGNTFTLTFEPRVVSYMRAHKSAEKARRGKLTRAQFILSLVRHIKRIKITFISPELRKHQPIRKAQEPRDATGRNKRREPGLDAGFKVEIDGQEASEHVLKTLERVLVVGDQKGASKKVQIVTLMCILQESRGKTSATNGTHVGLFQQDPRYWPATRNPEKDAEAWYEAVIEKDELNPRMKPIDLIESVQRSGQPAAYGKWRGTAEKIVEAFSGTVGRRNKETHDPYEFRVQKQENFWATGIRLAEEVQWRLFTIRDDVYYISEEDLFKSKALMTLREGVGGVDWIDYDDDERREITEVHVSCRMGMWSAPLGSTVIVADDSPADGKYLVTALRRSYFSLSGEATLRKPMKEKQEPQESSSTGGADGYGKVSDKRGARGIVEGAARIAAEAGGPDVYVGSSYRPGSQLESGQPSDHSRNDSTMAARDIGVKGVDLIVGPPSAKLDKAVVAIGKAFGRDYKPGNTIIDTFQWQGYRVQIIWRTPKYGGHMGHIHIGAKKT